MLHEKSEDVLKALYKSASFVLQAITFNRTGKYISHQSELLSFVDEEEKVIINTFLTLKNSGSVEFERMSKVLFDWCKKHI